MTVFLTVAVCTIAFITVTILSVLLIKNKRSTEALTKSIEDFMNGNGKTDYSTADNSFARLQNSISDLETQLLLQRKNTADQTKKNVDFVTDISHQLKTPLAGLRLYCEMEQEISPSAYNEKELLLISKMENLVFDLLKLEKIKSDAYTMNFTSHELSEIINEAVGFFRPLFPEKHFEINGSADIRCDREWISEAVGNIIKNSCEHTADDGGVFVAVFKNDSSAILVIEDNGGGVPKEQLPLLFNRFFRSDNSSENSAGIGLSIAKAIFDKHHATVTAENGQHGLKISVCFPIINASEKIQPEAF